MTDSLRPPRLWRRLLALAADFSERAELLGDLDDEFARRSAASGVSAARHWYRRQALASAWPLLSRRLTLRPAVRQGAWLDAKLALRSLRAAPGFSASVVVMLGLAVGAHTVVFAVSDARLWRPLPFGDRSSSLVTLHAVHPRLAPDWHDSGMSYADLLDVRRESATLERLDAVAGRDVSLSVGDSTERVLAASMTPGLFATLGISPVLGRDFRSTDAAPPGFEEVVIISHALWQTLFDGDEQVIGRAVGLNGRQLSVVGVMPLGFSFPEQHRMWLPYRAEDEQAGRGNRGFLAVALLGAGVGRAQAEADLQAIARRLADRHPQTNLDWSIRIASLREAFVSAGTRTLLATLLAAVSLLLVVACANVAGLMIARGAARHRELLIRMALGSSRARLVRLLMIEVLVLAVAGGALGFLLAGWGVHALVSGVPELPPYWAVPAIDLRVAVFAGLLMALVAAMTGLVPALRVSRSEAAGVLRSDVRWATAALQRPARRFLVAVQTALSLSLVVGALLLARSASALLTADAGFDPGPLLSARFYIAGDRYDPIESRTALVHEIVRRVAAVGGVLGAAATGSIPSDDGGATIRLQHPASGDEIGARTTSVTPGFWTALSLELLDGRSFSETESLDSDGDAVIINERLAGRLWPGNRAIGRAFHAVQGDDVRTLRVVGVAPDLVYGEFGEPLPQSDLMVYVPYARLGWRTQSLLIHAPPDPGRVADAVRAEIRDLDAGLAVYDVLTMPDRRAYNHWGDRFVGRTMTGFAIATVLLACLGVYAVVSTAVVERRREIGVRVAVGADRASILRLFLASGFRLAVMGVLVGLPLALAAARLLESRLFRVSPWTGAVWFWPPLVVVAAVLVASYLPARLATRTDPVSALRAD